MAFSMSFAHPTGEGPLDQPLPFGRSSISRQIVICEGWVLKKRRKKMQGFARRYFVLYQSGILSYSFGPGKPPRDEISLPRAAISTAPGRKDIHIDSNVATFHIKCLSTDDFNNWMSAFRRFVMTDAQRASTIRSPRLANWSINKLGSIVDEMGSTISELEDSILEMQHEVVRQQEHSLGQKTKYSKDKHKERSKEVTTLFALFKKSGGHSSTSDSIAEDNLGDSSSSRSQMSSPDRLHTSLHSLKSQHVGLLKCMQTLSQLETNQFLTQGSVLPSTAEEDDSSSTPVLGFSPMTRLSKRSSTTASFTDTVTEWFDASDGFDGAQEFVLDIQSSPMEIDQENKAEIHDSHSSLEIHDSGPDTEGEDDREDTPGTPKNAKPTPLPDKVSQVVRRNQLGAGPVGDEGGLFSILKKNVGKDLSTITFPVTFNEPLTLLQRIAEELEYYDVLNQAAATPDPIERLCYVAAFAVSGYAHTRFRTGRKGFTPMLAETFEDVRMKFIAEKVQHQPLIMAYHAEGEGWELYATSAGKTRFWGKSLEIIPLGTTHLKIGSDHFEWKKPSSFVRNLMMGTKYLEHCGKLTIDNTTSKAHCVLDFKQSGLFASSNMISGTIHSPSGELVAELEGKWDDHISRTVDSSTFRILWRVSAFPMNAREFYGFTTFGITLNEITSDLEGVLPPTDSRYRPDVRALEEGNVDIAESEKLRIEEMQRERRKQHNDREPRWFKQVGDEWIYTGEYWAERLQGWKGVKIDSLW